MTSTEKEQLADLQGDGLQAFLQGNFTGEQLDVIMLENKHFRKMQKNSMVGIPKMFWADYLGSPLRDLEKDTFRNTLYSYNDNPLP